MGREVGAPRPPSWAVAGVLAAWVLVGLGWALVTPTFAGVDEGAHTALVRDVRSERSYPLERTGFEPRTAALFGWLGRQLVDDRYTEVVPARDQRPTFAEPGPLTPRTGTNQMVQHPPLPYVATAGALAGLDAAAGLDDRSFDVELLALRLVHVAVTATGAAFILGAARRLGLRPWVQVVAAILPLAVPQLFHVGSAVGNDGWLVAASAAATAGLAAVAAGDERARTAIALGAAVGITALTKAFGLLLVPAVLLVHLLVAGGGRARAVGTRAGLAVGVSVVIAGWWWVGNVVRTGSLQPHGAPLRSQAPPPGFEPEGLEWFRRFASWMAVRYWGWFGEFSRGQRVPVGLVAVATGVGIVLVAAALLSGRGALVRFAGVAVGLHVLALLVVGWEARALYVDTGLPNGIQGRYLYVALPALAVAAAGGAQVLLDRWPRGRVAAGALLVAGVVAMQVTGVAAVLRGSWGEVGSSVGASVTALRGWAPIDGSAVVLMAVLGLAVAALAGAALAVEREP